MSSSAASENKSRSPLELDRQYLGVFWYELQEDRWRELAAQAITTASSRGDHTAARHFVNELTQGVYAGEGSKRLEVIEKVRSSAFMTPFLFHLLNQAERKINVKILDQQLRSGPHICLGQYKESRTTLDMEKEYLGDYLLNIDRYKKSTLVAQAIIQAVSLDDVKAVKFFLHEFTYGFDQGDDSDKLVILGKLRSHGFEDSGCLHLLQKAEQAIKKKIEQRQLVASSDKSTCSWVPTD